MLRTPCKNGLQLNIFHEHIREVLIKLENVLLFEKLVMRSMKKKYKTANKTIFHFFNIYL